MFCQHYDYVLALKLYLIFKYEAFGKTFVHTYKVIATADLQNCELTEK